MQYLSVKELLVKERKRNAAVLAAAAKNTADIDYIAMMCDVELEAPEDEGAMHNDDEEA